MTYADDLRAKYREYSTTELLNLAAAGPDALTAEAQQVLREELSTRRDVPSAAAAIPSPLLADAPTISTPSVASLGPWGGWLTVFQILVGVQTILSARAISTALRADLDLLAAMLVAQSALNLLGLYLIAYRKRSAPQFWTTYLILNAVVSLFWYFGGTQVARSAFLAAAGQVAWAMYWQASSRVRLTFREPLSLGPGS